MYQVLETFVPRESLEEFSIRTGNVQYPFDVVFINELGDSKVSLFPDLHPHVVLEDGFRFCVVCLVNYEHGVVITLKLLYCLWNKDCLL